MSINHSIYRVLLYRLIAVHYSDGEIDGTFNAVSNISSFTPIKYTLNVLPTALSAIPIAPLLNSSRM
jgi:hypothetical protein